MQRLAGNALAWLIWDGGRATRPRDDLTAKLLLPTAHQSRLHYMRADGVSLDGDDVRLRAAAQYAGINISSRRE